VAVSLQGPSKIRTARLEADCLRLRMDGLSHRKIAARLGVAPSTAYKRIHHALVQINSQTAEDAKTMRTLEALRLDELQAALWEKATSGHGPSIDRVLAIMARRARLFGLDGPEKIETSPCDPQELRFRRDLLIKQLIAEVRRFEAERA